jgi:hypothetical protein
MIVYTHVWGIRWSIRLALVKLHMGLGVKIGLEGHIIIFNMSCH